MFDIKKVEQMIDAHLKSDNTEKKRIAKALEDIHLALQDLISLKRTELRMK